MSSPHRRSHLGPLGLATAAAGLLATAFGLGQRYAPAQLDPRKAAAQVSEALQTASADAARSVVQVESFRRSRGRLRKILDGSGVVIDESGLVVTNHHVITGATAFRVVFTSGERCDAELLGSDESTDLALLRVTADREYEPMALRTELPPVGELVLAVGNPLSLGHTVTLGVVESEEAAVLKTDVQHRDGTALTHLCRDSPAQNIRSQEKQPRADNNETAREESAQLTGRRASLESLQLSLLHLVPKSPGQRPAKKRRGHCVGTP